MTVDYSRERHEARVEAERLLLDGDDRPAPADLVGDRPPPPADPSARQQDPWQEETLQPGVRVFHVSRRHEHQAVAEGTGTIVASRRLGDDVEYQIAYDRGGMGWHGSSDVRRARCEGDGDVPF